MLRKACGEFDDLLSVADQVLDDRVLEQGGLAAKQARVFGLDPSHQLDIVEDGLEPSR